MTADQCSKCAHYMPTIDGLCSMCRPKPDPLIGTWRVWKEPYPFALRDAWKGRPFVLLDRFHIRYAGDVHAIAWDDSIAATHSRPATTLEVFEAWYASDPRVTAHAPAVTDPRVGAVKIAAVDDADVYWIGGGDTCNADAMLAAIDAALAKPAAQETPDAKTCGAETQVVASRDRVAPSGGDIGATVERPACNCDQARELRAELERVTQERDELRKAQGETDAECEAYMNLCSDRWDMLVDALGVRDKLMAEVAALTARLQSEHDGRWLDTYNAALSGGAGNFSAAFADVAHGKRGTR